MNGGLIAALQRQVSLGNLVRALQLAADAYQQSDVETRYHLRALVGWIADNLRAHHQPASLPNRVTLPPPLADALAATTAAAKRAPALAPGEALALLVDADRSDEAFIGRLVLRPSSANPPSSPVHGTAIAAPGPSAATTLSFTEAIDTAVQVVFRYLLQQPGCQPHPSLVASPRFMLTLPENEPPPLVHDGSSIGLAAAVALYGAWTGDCPADDLLLSGALAPDGRIRPVGRLEDKIRCALRERPTLRAILVPAEGSSTLVSIDPRVQPVEQVDDLLREVFGDRAQIEPQVIDVDSSLRYGLQLYEQASSFAAAAEVFDQVAAALHHRPDASQRQRDTFVALWRAASCRLHLGQLDEAEQGFQRAADLDAALWSAGEISPEHHFGFRGNLAVLLRDRLRFEEAEQLLRATLAEQQQLRQDKRQLAKTLGNLGELLSFVGRLDEAEPLLLEALQHVQTVYPDEAPRELYYLGNLCLLRGDPRGAVGRFEQGRAANLQAEHGGARNAAFLSYGLTRARLALGEPEAAETIATAALSRLSHADPYPRQAILKYRGLCRWAAGRRQRAERDLDEAADLTWTRGALMRFVVSTANGEHALLLLADDDDPRQAVELARRFASDARGIIDHDWPRSAADLLEEIVAGPVDPPARAALAVLVRRCLDRLPY